MYYRIFRRLWNMFGDVDFGMEVHHGCDDMGGFLTVP